MKRFLWALSIVAVLGGAAQAGPTSDLYLTAGDNGNKGKNWLVQGTSTTMFSQAHRNEYAIAVSGDVRTTGTSDGNLGAQYTLGGVSTGVDYAATVGYVYDGTTDGTVNYSVDYITGLVYQFDRDWSTPTLLFDSALGNNNAVGITYDTGTGTLWVSEWNGTTVNNYTLGGTLLSSFSTGFNSITALAYDSADGTLWMGTQTDLGVARTLYQYSTAGLLLSTETYASLANQNYLGGEFNVVARAVPEPASLTLLGIAAISGGVVRFRRKRAAI